MNDRCLDFESLLPTLAEDPAAPEPGTSAAQHLARCRTCRERLQMEREMHALLRARAGALEARAPDGLRTRIADGMASTASGRRRWALVRMPVAATLLLAMVGSVGYGLTSASSTVLAAQLALDHLKCVRLVSPDVALNPVQAVREWAQRYQWTPRMPTAARVQKASLVGVRRCLYGHGHLAHLLYDVDGETISVFVMPRSEYPASAAPARHTFLGQQAEVWAHGDQSFAIVGDVDAATLTTLAQEFRAATE